MSDTSQRLVDLEVRINELEKQQVGRGVHENDPRFGDNITVIIEEPDKTDNKDALSYFCGMDVLIAPAGLELSEGDRIKVKVILAENNLIKALAVSHV